MTSNGFFFKKELSQESVSFVPLQLHIYPSTINEIPKSTLSRFLGKPRSSD